MEDIGGQPPQYLLAHLHEMLAEDPRVNELGVQAELAGTKVFLTGCVSTPERREAVTVVVSELLPGFDVHNETTVCMTNEHDVEELS